MVPTTVGARLSITAATEVLLRAQSAVAARENFILRDECKDWSWCQLSVARKFLVVSE